MNRLLSNKTVLVVDDDRDFLDTHKAMFEAMGAEVLTACGRREAEAITERTQPDLAVVDLMMDEMDDGFVLSYHLKKKYSDLPVIIVTGVTSETGLVFQDPGGVKQDWIKADALLAKPIRFEQLQREINQLFGEA